MEWHFIIIMYLNMVFGRFLINHSMFLIFNDTGRTAFKFGRFEYFFVFLRPVFWEIPKWRYIKMLLYYSQLFVWYIKYFKCLFQHYDVIQQHCEVTQPHSSIPPAAKGVSQPYPLLARFVLGGGREGDYQLNPTTRYARTPPLPRVKKGVSRPYPLLARFPQELRTNINVKVFDCERSERAICERSEA